MKIPPRLYRFRPLDESLFQREMDTLVDSYLYAPSFRDMNDPMEAFYEMGGPGDWIVDAMLDPAEKRIEEIYRIVNNTISHFGLVSFAKNYDVLPMWAYYGSNFSGMCLEFDTAAFEISDFQNEELRPITYARTALRPLSAADLFSKRLQAAMIARLTRKRIEWAHEKEWRYIVGSIGPKYYVDDALKRIFLGPRIKPEYADYICKILARRPVEVLHGEIHGFQLRFKTIKPACPPVESERVGAGTFNPENQIVEKEKMQDFLTVPFDRLLKLTREIAYRPNMEEFLGIDVANNMKGALYISTVYKLRNGRKVYLSKYFDRKLQLLPSR